MDVAFYSEHPYRRGDQVYTLPTGRLATVVLATSHRVLVLYNSTNTERWLLCTHVEPATTPAR
jgi:hypothetical protein